MEKNQFVSRESFTCWMKKKLRSSEGLGTLEIVIIIAVLLAVAMIFREEIMSFAKDLMSKAFDYSVIDNL